MLPTLFTWIILHFRSIFVIITITNITKVNQTENKNEIFSLTTKNVNLFYENSFSPHIAVQSDTVCLRRLDDQPRDLPEEADQEGHGTVEAGSGVLGTGGRTDTAPSVNGHQDYDEPAGANECVANKDVKMCQIVLLKTIMFCKLPSVG